MVDFTALTNGGIAQLLPYRLSKPMELVQEKLTPQLRREPVRRQPQGT